MVRSQMSSPRSLGNSESTCQTEEGQVRRHVLELGFFLGRLGRDRVCALYADGVEVPSDYHGVAFVSLDSKMAWKLELARELKAAGLGEGYAEVHHLSPLSERPEGDWDDRITTSLDQVAVCAN